MIEVTDLTKAYGQALAVDHLSFAVRPGIVTGFLGPNGAGKSTTMRMMLGLDRPTSGTVLIDGRPYASSRAPIATIGALLDAKAVDKGRSARSHLRALAATVGIGRKRVEELLETVGLAQVANRSTGGFSLGMGQRLGIASALLADPEIVILDEPVNGLDPDGILWIRNLLKGLAAEGRTVFLSSHLMSEMEITAEHLVVIGKGKLIADVTMTEFIAMAGLSRVQVVSPDAAELGSRIAATGATVIAGDHDSLTVHGTSAVAVGDIAHDSGIRVHELHTIEPSLEEAFMNLTEDAVAYRGAPASPLAHDLESADR